MLSAAAMAMTVGLRAFIVISFPLPWKNAVATMRNQRISVHVNGDGYDF